MKSIRLSTMAACVAGVLGLAPMALAQAPAKQAAPANKGEAVMAAVEVTATVTKIDQATRAVTLKADSGEVYSFVVDSAVKNLAQVKAGDVVKVAYTEALAYEVKKGGKAVGERDHGRRSGARRWAPRPAGAVGQTDHGDGGDHRDRHTRSFGDRQGRLGRDADDQGDAPGKASGRERGGHGRAHIHRGDRAQGGKSSQEVTRY